MLFSKSLREPAISRWCLIAAYPIEKNGSLAPASKFIQHTGSSIAGERQQGPHAHSTIVSPNDEYLYAADLGIDKVKAYKIDFMNNTMDPVPASDIEAIVPLEEE